MSTTTAPAPILAGPLPLEWRGDKLAITSAEALKRVDRSAMSASTMNAMRGCPSRYVAEKLLPRDEDPFSPAALGTSAHTVFERLFNDRATRRTQDRAMQHLIDLGDEVWRPSEEVQRLQWSAAVMDKVIPLFKITDPAQVSVLSTEERFNGVEVGGVPFDGFIDLVEQLENDAIQVSDFKTGKATSGADAKRWGDPEGDQLRLYFAAYEARYGIKPKYAALYYTGVGRSRRVSVTGPAVKRTTGLFVRAWQDLKGYVACGEFATKVTALCGWCPLVNSCPAAKAEGKEAKVPAPSADHLGIVSPQGHGPVRKRRTWDMTQDLIQALERDELDPVQADEATDVFAELDGQESEEAWHKDHRAAHQDDEPRVSGSSASLTSKEIAMIDGFTRREAKPWEDPHPDGDLDPNSYTSTALFGLVSLAVEQLGTAGIKISPSTVKGLSGTFATIVLDAQEEMVGTRDWGAGANTRLRGALHAVLKTVPLPFGGSEEDWDAWVAVATRRSVSIAKTVITLHTDSYGGRPWADLATRAVPDAA
ncbi:RecB family exonuclease [Pseudactinotalea sp. Z1748]|uniref:RecB family exonuclease n=1 Tax=Pseudactinotalea sp. Z1748 TaxID=3413027 RepID=UPI003C7D9FF0